MNVFFLFSAVDCEEHYNNGNTADGVYTINPDSPHQVYCDMTGGGWTVFQVKNIKNCPGIFFLL